MRALLVVNVGTTSTPAALLEGLKKKGEATEERDRSSSRCYQWRGEDGHHIHIQRERGCLDSVADGVLCGTLERDLCRFTKDRDLASTARPSKHEAQGLVVHRERGKW